MRPHWQTAFSVSIKIFIVTFLFAVVSIFVNQFIPDDVFYDPSYKAHTGVEAVIGLIWLSGMALGVALADGFQFPIQLVEVHVGQNRTDHRALGGATISFVVFPVFYIARLKKLTDQVDEPVIFDFLSQLV